MIDKRLQNYITANLNNNVPVEKIREALLAAGWQESLVTDALKSHTLPVMKLKAVESNSAKLAWGIVIFLIILIIVGVVGFVVYNKDTEDLNTKKSLSTQLLINEIQNVNESLDLNNCKDDIGCLLKGIVEGKEVYGVPSLKTGEKLSIWIDKIDENSLTVELQDSESMDEGTCISAKEVFSTFLSTWKKTSEKAMGILNENADCSGKLFDNLEKEEEIIEEDVEDVVEEIVEEIIDKDIDNEDVLEDIQDDKIEEEIIEE